MTTDEAVAEIGAVMKKAGLVWLSWNGQRAMPAWFATVDGAYVVLADRDGSAEQPLPGLADADAVQVVVPAKPATSRLASWTAAVRRLEPGTEEWTAAALVLRTERLNAAGLGNQLDRWQAQADVLVLEPTGAVTTTYDDTHPAVTPPETSATTRGKRPITLHKRARRRPKLS
ncbi:hypothetical protein Kfla_5402 [Kribbella flavida DSM 17836]|uniref:Pyridoxamine 5'-phosphate oxidase putative domain-containing protein n=1 Tax=Kribbella flavida (strain DSM 17836 / JCM 10339 / NBRC 14399) TaxID=479435 RepID=D2PM47_KRIFD|nr:hypothetical protein [Kribbella flavida]ADB34415.1 hypothetical protein Kfla_5402 [Kribbella flavida DSM 17836]